MNSESIEEHTIERAIDGDSASQRRLYEAYHAAASRLAYLVLRNAMDAEEVVQDAFAYAFRNLDRYDAGRGSFWTWLRVILVSRCRNKRRRKRLPRVSIEVLRLLGQPPGRADVTNQPQEALERWDVRRAVYEALQQVSPGSREALILRYYEGLAYGDIAELLGCSRDAARSRVAYGKSQLRELLQGSAGQPAPERGTVRSAEAG